MAEPSLVAATSPPRATRVVASIRLRTPSLLSRPPSQLFRAPSPHRESRSTINLNAAAAIANANAIAAAATARSGLAADIAALDAADAAAAAARSTLQADVANNTAAIAGGAGAAAAADVTTPAPSCESVTWLSNVNCHVPYPGALEKYTGGSSSWYTGARSRLKSSGTAGNLSS